MMKQSNAKSPRELLDPRLCRGAIHVMIDEHGALAVLLGLLAVAVPILALCGSVFGVPAQDCGLRQPDGVEYHLRQHHLVDV